MLNIFKPLILIYFFISAAGVQASDTIFAELFFKKSIQRIERLFKESMEAQVFLDEDLKDAFDLVDKAQIKWIPSLSIRPYLNRIEPTPLITLSSNLTFKTTTEGMIEMALEMLFELKRQMEGSLLPIPTTRINLFAMKFASTLLDDVDSCSSSIAPLPPSLDSTLRAELQHVLISKLEEKDYSYDSTWGNNLFYVDLKETTDAECGGKNRNLITIKIYLVNIKTRESKLLIDETKTSCGHSTVHREKVIRKIRRKFKRKLPKCNRAFGHS